MNVQLILLAVLWAGAVATAAVAQPISIGTHRQIFFDDRVIEKSHGLTRTMHPVAKYEGNPVMVRENAWEGIGPALDGCPSRKPVLPRERAFRARQDRPSILRNGVDPA